MAVSQVIARPVRTATQMATATIIMEVIDSSIVDMSDRQYGAWAALLTLALGLAQVFAENQFGKGFLRKPKPAEKPVDIVEDIDNEGV